MTNLISDNLKPIPEISQGENDNDVPVYIQYVRSDAPISTFPQSGGGGRGGAVGVGGRAIYSQSRGIR